MNIYNIIHHRKKKKSRTLGLKVLLFGLMFVLFSTSLFSQRVKIKTVVYLSHNMDTSYTLIQKDKYITFDFKNKVIYNEYLKDTTKILYEDVKYYYEEDEEDKKIVTIYKGLSSKYKNVNLYLLDRDMKKNVVYMVENRKYLLIFEMVALKLDK